MGTGASLPRYDNFLDEDGRFGTSGTKNKSSAARNALDDFNSPDDSLNKINRHVFEGL